MNKKSNRTRRVLRSLFGIAIIQLTATAITAAPLVGESVVFQEQDGMLAVEAEHFFKQTNSDVRSFYLTSSDTVPSIKPDGDPPHVAGASGGA